jgi:hypothetical protein
LATPVGKKQMGDLRVYRKMWKEILKVQSVNADWIQHDNIEYVLLISNTVMDVLVGLTQDRRR